MRKVSLVLFFTALLSVILTSRENYLDIHETIAHSSTNCAITAGSSEATILTASTAAGTNSCTGSTGTNVVNLAAGTYNWTSAFNIPCGSNTWTLTGPVVPLAPVTEGGYVRNEVTPTAIISSSIGSSNWGFIAPTCTTGFTLQYFEWNGNRPSAGGGGFGYAAYGASGYTVQYVYAHGFNVQLYTSPPENSTFWLVDGCINGASGCTNPGPTASNLLFQFNRIGSADAGDCSGIMSTFQYIPNNNSGAAYGSAGGYCGTFGVYSNTTNVTVQNNNWFHIEQAGKCYAGTRIQNNFIWRHNDIMQWHRIGFEGQCAVGPTGAQENFDGNSIHDAFFPGYGTWPLSLPQSSGAAGSLGQTNHYNNLLIENTTVATQAATFANCEQYAPNWSSTTAYSAGAGVQSGGQGYSAKINVPAGTALSNTTYWKAGCYGGTNLGGFYYSPYIEFWGNGTASHNLAQSALTNSAQAMTAPGCQTGPGLISYNTFQSAAPSPIYFSTPNEQCNTATSPTSTGNATIVTSPTTFTSAAPSISISGNTVTITSNGYTSSTSTIPTGNTSAWYTLDGTTPAAGTSTFCGVSCSFTAANGTVVKVIAMWGAQNQPASYATNYGFVPSAIISQTVAGGTVTLVSITIATTGGGTSFAQGATNQLIATGTYSDTSTQNLSSSVTWTSSNTAVGTVSTTGLFTAGSTSGTTNIGATYLSITATPNPFTLTVTGNPTIVSCGITQVSNINTIPVGGTIQFTTTALYSDGNTRSIPDAFGNTNGYYTVAGTGTGTVTSTGGLYTASTIGTVHVHNTLSSNNGCSSWDVTNTAAVTLTSITLATTGGITSLTVGSSNQLIATGHYSDSSTQNLTSSITTWAVSNSAYASINPSGSVVGVAPGVPTFTATYSGITSSPALAITITSGVVLQSIVVTQINSVNTMKLGWYLPFNAQCYYSNGNNYPCGQTADPQGNLATFTSGNLSLATFNTYILNEIGVGNSYVTATVAGVTSAQYTLSYLPAAPAIFDITGTSVTIKGSKVVIN
jgi:hypothetical protein